MAQGTNLLTLNEPPGSGALAADFQLFGKSPLLPNKEFRVPLSRLPGAEGADLPTNSAKSGQKFYRYRTRAEADQPGADGGAVLEELDYLTICTYAHVVVERYREDPTDLTEVPHYQELVAVYDGTPDAKKGCRDGSFEGDLIGLTLIKLEDFLVPVSTVNVPLLDPEKLDNVAGVTVHYPVNGQELLFLTANNGGPFAAPTDSSGTNNWIPQARQVPPTALSQAYDLPYARYVASGYSDAVVVPGRLYLIKGGWDNGAPDQVVSVEGVQGGFATTGSLLVGGVLSAVSVNVAAGTTAPLGGGAGGAPTWQPGKQTASALVWWQGKLYRTKQDITSGQSSPDGNTQYYDLVSDPALLALHTQQLAALGTTVSLTYSQAVLLAGQNKLDVTRLYALTYTPRHTIAGTSDVHIGQPETLLLRARSSSAFNQMGLSQTYGDTVWYDPTNSGRLPGSTEGAVIRRFDALYNNDLEIDFRNVVFRRWLVDLAVPDFNGATTAYVSAVDNGRPYRDYPILGYYFKCRNNRWTGFAQTRIAQSATISIFDYLNFVSINDEDSRTLNTQFTNAVVRGVTVHSGAWIDGLKIENGQLLDSYAVRVAQRTFFGGTISNSTISGKVVTTEETGFTVIRSALTIQPLAGTTYIDSQPYGGGGGGSTIFTGTYQAPTTGEQTITKAGATWFGSVGISTVGGRSISLAPGPQVAGGPAPGYTFVAGQLTILDAAGVQANDVITYEYATGAVSGGTASVKTVNGVGPDAAGNVTVPTSGGAHAQPIFVSQDAAAYKLTVRPAENYRYTELEASLNIATVTPTAIAASMVQPDGSIVLNTGAVDRAAGTVGVRARLAGGRAASPWTTNPQAYVAAATSPKPTAGLDFNSDGVTNQRMAIPLPALAEWGMSVWFKRRTAWAESAYFFDARGGVSSDVYVLDSLGAGVTITPGGSSALPGANLRYLNTGQFIRLFINGTGPVSAGTLQFFERFTGGEPLLEIELSDLRFYGRNFTAAEMADSTSASSDGLIRRYALDSTTTGSVLVDISGANVNGSLSGF